jgi:hypothetical protein
MFKILGKNRKGLITVLPDQYDSHRTVNKAIEKFATEQLNTGAQFIEHLEGISTAYYPDGSQVEYWRSTEELLRKGLPIF